MAHPNHSGKRPGAGRKPALNPLRVVRLRDPGVRAALAALTAHEREASGNPALSQEQLVARLITAAHQRLAEARPPHTAPDHAYHDQQTHMVAVRAELRHLVGAAWAHPAISPHGGMQMIALATTLLDMRDTAAPVRAVCHHLERVGADAPTLPQDIHDLAQICVRHSTTSLILDAIKSGYEDTAGSPAYPRSKDQRNNSMPRTRKACHDAYL